MTAKPIQRHPLYGVAAPELGWVPAPSYLLRRDRILRRIRPLRPGAVLEVGAGAGALIDDLARLGHSCDALETSPGARKLAETLHAGNENVRVHAVAEPGWSGRFDYVLAFEVLEHIDDDSGALRQWFAWLRPGGHLLISVPAHARRWSASDEWAGHFRRYERADLLQRLEEAGFTGAEIECYGFPLANAIEPLRAHLHRRAMTRQRATSAAPPDREANNSRSGTERSFESRLFPLQASFAGTAIMRASFALQNMSVRTDLGTGYLALARKQ